MKASTPRFSSLSIIIALAVASTLAAFTLVSVDKANARTRSLVEMGDPDIGENKPGSGPAKAVTIQGKAGYDAGLEMSVKSDGRPAFGLYLARVFFLNPFWR